MHLSVDKYDITKANFNKVLKNNIIDTFYNLNTTEQNYYQVSESSQLLGYHSFFKVWHDNIYVSLQFVIVLVDIDVFCMYIAIEYSRRQAF